MPHRDPGGATSSRQTNGGDASRWRRNVQPRPCVPPPPVVLHTRLAAEGPRVPGSAWHESRWHSPCLLPVPNEQSRDTPRLRAPDREPSTSEKCCPPAAQLVLGRSCPISWFLLRRPDPPRPHHLFQNTRWLGRGTPLLWPPEPHVAEPAGAGAETGPVAVSPGPGRAHLTRKDRGPRGLPRVEVGETETEPKGCDCGDTDPSRPHLPLYPRSSSTSRSPSEAAAALHGDRHLPKSQSDRAGQGLSPGQETRWAGRVVSRAPELSRGLQVNKRVEELECQGDTGCAWAGHWAVALSATRDLEPQPPRERHKFPDSPASDRWFPSFPWLATD